MATIVIGAIVFSLFAAVILNMYKKKKRTGKATGCSCCSGCANSANCYGYR